MVMNDQQSAINYAKETREIYKSQGAEKAFAHFMAARVEGADSTSFQVFCNYMKKTEAERAIMKKAVNRHLKLDA